MKNLKLNKMADSQLSEKEMSQVKGGAGTWTCGDDGMCGCACAYANKGGSSTSANMSANSSKATSSVGQTMQNGDTYVCGDFKGEMQNGQVVNVGYNW